MWCESHDRVISLSHSLFLTLFSFTFSPLLFTLVTCCGVVQVYVCICCVSLMVVVAALSLLTLCQENKVKCMSLH